MDIAVHLDLAEWRKNFLSIFEGWGSRFLLRWCRLICFWMCLFFFLLKSYSILKSRLVHFCQVCTDLYFFESVMLYMAFHAFFKYFSRATKTHCIIKFTWQKRLSYPYWCYSIWDHVCTLQSVYRFLSPSAMSHLSLYPVVFWSMFRNIKTEVSSSRIMR